MPINLIYHADEQVSPRMLSTSTVSALTEGGLVQKTFNINGYVGKEAGCKATLAILPRAFLGWHSQFREGAGPLQLVGKTMDDAGGAWYTVNP